MRQEKDLQQIHDAWVLPFKGIDRETPKSNLPSGFSHIKKEIYTDEKVIIKFSNYKKNNLVDKYAFENEAFWLKMLEGTNRTPKLLDYYENEKQVFLKMEHLKGKSLGDLKWKEIKLIKENLKYFYNELDNIKSMLKKNEVVHRDITPQNIIFISEGKLFRLSLIDFQYAIKFGQQMKFVSSDNDHYKKVIENIGGKWRDKSLNLNSYENDEFSLEQIKKYFKSINLFKFIKEKVGV